MKTIGNNHRNSNMLNEYILAINLDRLFFKCLLFFGSILGLGILVFIVLFLN